MTTKGYFGEFGGSFVPEPIQGFTRWIGSDFWKIQGWSEFLAEFRRCPEGLFRSWNTALPCRGLTEEHLGGAKIYLKREDLNHLGSHKLNNVLGPFMGKACHCRTGAGQHGVRLRATAAKFSMACDVYMGAEMWSVNVSMSLHGDDGVFHAVETGTRHPSKIRLIHALEHGWTTWSLRLGFCCRTSPLSTIVHEFQRLLVKNHVVKSRKEGRLPDYVIACVGGGSNAIGAFHSM